MNKSISGVITSIFPNDINTDDIIPAWTLQESTERAFFKSHAFENYDPNFIKRCKKHKKNVIIAGKNFGCGSSREQAIYAIQENHVVAVIAEGYPDIFSRNAVNNGLILIAIPDIRTFKLGQKVSINLEKKTVTIDGEKTIQIHINRDDELACMKGGKIYTVKHHLENILSGKKEIIKKVRPHKSQTIGEKIVSDHIGKTVYAGMKIEKLPIDILFFNEVIGPPAIHDFLTTFQDIYKKYKKPVKVYNPRKIFFIPDHTVPSSSIAVSEGITFMEKFARNQHITCYKEGDGIEHVVLIEDGYITPGQIVLGTDSHTDTNGALNTLAFGIGTTDGCYAIATGYLYDFEIPRTIRVNLKKDFRKGVYSKDLILYLIGSLGVDGASRKIVEFGGSALKYLSMDSRTTIANMAVEMGARTAIFEFDNILERYLKKRAKFPYKPYFPDKACTYEQTINIDLSTLEPQVAFPHKPGNVTSISHIHSYIKNTHQTKSPDVGKVSTLKISDAFLGACTNGRYEDFVEAAKILKGRKIHKNVNFVVIPASRKVYARLLQEGILAIFSEAGANIESSNCGPCFGKHMGVVGRGAQMISSSNRNYLGRMGSKEAHIFLASPVTVTAAAIKGEIVDPRLYL